jgi:two-component system chemotaxis response regulator CheB
VAAPLIVVGCSCGGLSALISLLGGLGQVDAPVVVAQHRRHGPSRLAELLRAATGWTVEEAEDKEALVPGRVFLAPAGYHLLVEDGHLALSMEGLVRASRPSVDVLFESAAIAYRVDVVGVILTGANADGAAGAAAIASRGGRVVVQDPGTAEQPVMPRAALATGVSATVLPLDAIGPFLRELCRAKRQPSMEAATP